MGSKFFSGTTETGLLKSQLQTALGELIAHGLITADSFQGLRHLIQLQASQKRRRKHTHIHDPLASAGRWSLLRPAPKVDENRQPAIEHIAGILLKRYGIVFRTVLLREENIPSWRELLYVYRRMEARGELRGGRFVQGFSGEQYALPEAIASLRNIRKQQPNENLITLCATDPLNLCGIIIPGEKIAALPKNRILFRDGIPLAIHESNKIIFLQTIESEQEWHFRNILLKN
jgi:ATP-dependent Lhr-like helicase